MRIYRRIFYNSIELKGYTLPTCINTHLHIYYILYILSM